MARHAAPVGPGGVLVVLALATLRRAGYAVLAAVLALIAHEITTTTSRIRDEIGKVAPQLGGAVDEISRLRSDVVHLPTALPVPVVTVQAPRSGYGLPSITVTTAPGPPGPAGPAGNPGTNQGASTPRQAPQAAAPGPTPAAAPCLLGLAVLCPSNR